MSIIALLSQFKYHLFIPIAIVEGPIITIIGAFLATIGVFNIYVVYLISVGADIFGDVALYAMGRFGAPLLGTRLGRWVGLTPTRLKRAEDYYQRNHRWALVTSKLVHGVGGFGLAAAGALRVNFGDFLKVIIPTVFLQSGVLMLLGVLFGRAYIALGHDLNDYAAIASAVALVVVVYIVARIYLKKMVPNGNR